MGQASCPLKETHDLLLGSANNCHVLSDKLEHFFDPLSSLRSNGIDSINSSGPHIF